MTCLLLHLVKSCLRQLQPLGDFNSEPSCEIGNSGFGDFTPDVCRLLHLREHSTDTLLPQVLFRDEPGMVLRLHPNRSGDIVELVLHCALPSTGSVLPELPIGLSQLSRLTT